MSNFNSLLSDYCHFEHKAKEMGIKSKNKLYAMFLKGVEMCREDMALNVKWFGASGDGKTDDTQAIQKAIDTAFDSGKMAVYVPAGVYKITSPLLLVTSTDSNNLGQRWWDGHGVILYGDSCSTSIITKCGDGTWQEPINVVHETEKERAFMQDSPIDSTVVLSGLGTGVHIHSLYLRNESTSKDAYAIYGSRSRSCIEHVNVNSYKGINMYSFFNTLRDIRYNCVENALTIGQGTSSVFEKMFVGGCKNPYDIDCSYSNVNNLAADGCTGTIYKVCGLGLALNACGTESPYADYVLSTGYGASVTVNNLYWWRQNKAAASPIRFSSGASLTINGLSMLDNFQLSAKQSIVSLPAHEKINLHIAGLSAYRSGNVDNTAYNQIFSAVPSSGSHLSLNFDGLSGLYKVESDLSVSRANLIQPSDTAFISEADGQYVNVPDYTNLLSVNDADYKEDYRFSGSGSIAADTAYWVSGFIPVSSGDVVRVRYASAANAPHLDRSAGNVWARPVLVRYNSSKSKIGDVVYEAGGVISIDSDHLGFSYSVPSGISYIRVSGRDTARNTVCTANEEIKNKTVWQGEPMRLKPEIKVTGENLVIKAPNGTNYTLAVDNSGNLSTSTYSG